MISAGGCLVLLVILGLIYGLILVFEDKFDNDYDDITEAHCKQCRYYDMCHRHGRDYNCKDYRKGDVK